MSPISKVALVLAAVFTLLSAGPAGEDQEVKYGVGNWDPEAGFGNHRVVVRVGPPSYGEPPRKANIGAKSTRTHGLASPLVAFVRIDWRRRDLEPEKKNVAV